MTKRPRMTDDELVLYKLWSENRASLPPEDQRGFNSFCRNHGIMGDYRRRVVAEREVPAGLIGA